MRTPVGAAVAVAGTVMAQSNVIFAFLFVAFLIFITVRGELPKYAALFL